MSWETFKKNAGFAMVVSGFLVPVGAVILGIYHHMVLFPLLERQYTPIIEQMIAEGQTKELGMDQVDVRIKDWTKAALHTALLADANHLLASYRAIPDKKPHQVQRMEEINDDRSFHQRHYDEADDKGLILPVFPPP